MRRFLSDLSLFKKICLPMAFVFLALLSICGTAYYGLNHLRATSIKGIDVSAKRLERMLTVLANVNAAMVFQQSAIMADTQDVQSVEIANYEARIKEAVAIIDDVIAMAGTDEQKNAIQEVKDKLLAYDRVGHQILKLAEDGNTQAAKNLSGGAGRVSQRGLHKLLDARVELDRKEMAGEKEEIQSLASRTNWQLGIAALLSQGIAMAIILRLISTFVVKPLGRMTNAMDRLAKGDLDISVEGTERLDEVGSLARSLQAFKDAAIERRALEDRQREDASRRQERQRRIETLTETFDGAVNSLMASVEDSMGSLHQAADALSAGAEQTQSRSASVSAAAERATSNVETVAAASNQLQSSIGEIGRQVTEASTIAEAAEREADDANGKIEQLAQTTSRIGEVVNLITDIASQTNLLALNATIEAARAGEAGKGFAVVASEVKNLANQTAKATEEISAQITSVQSDTALAVKAIRDVSGIISRMREISTASASAVEEQGAATSEIVRNVDEAARGTREVSSQMSQVATAASDTGRMAESVFDIAAAVREETKGLQNAVQEFLRGVATA